MLESAEQEKNILEKDKQDLTLAGSKVSINCVDIGFACCRQKVYEPSTQGETHGDYAEHRERKSCVG